MNRDQIIQMARARFGGYADQAASLFEQFANDIRSATKEEDARICAIHSQYPIENYYDRGYSKGRKDAEQAIRASK